MIELSKDNFKAEVEEFDGLCVIDLYATWCAPCKMLAPTVEELEKENPGVKFCKVDVDREPELAAAFRVSSIPMIALVKNDTFVDFSVGYVEKQTLQDLINKNK